MLGQGALAIEVAENNDFANSIATSINDESTFDAVSRERKFFLNMEEAVIKKSAYQ